MFASNSLCVLYQLIVQRFLEEGFYERHLNRMRALYKSRHDVLIEALRPFHGICRISGEHAGVHLLLAFEGDVREEELIRRAKERGVRVYGLSDYRLCKSAADRPTVLLGYANLSEGQIKDAVSILTQIWI